MPDPMDTPELAAVRKGLSAVTQDRQLMVATHALAKVTKTHPEAGAYALRVIDADAVAENLHA
jgi:hypothetical protein